MRLVLFVLALTTLLAVVGHNEAWAVADREWGLAGSTNFESLLPIGVLKELSAAPLLAGAGGYYRFRWIWGLHGRPWGQLFFGDDRNRLAGGFDLLWGNPRMEPDFAYVGFGLMVSDFLPRPITNFVLGYQPGGQTCNLSLELRFLFLTSFQIGFGCGF